MSDITTEVQQNYEDHEIYSVRVTEDRLGKYVEIVTKDHGMYYLTEDEIKVITQHLVKGDFK